MASLTVFGAACGGRAAGQAADGGTVVDGGAGPAVDASLPVDAAPEASPDGTVGNAPDSGADAAEVVSQGGGYFDAGYYYGDGSYWVDGGAYGSPDAGEEGETDAGPADGSSGVTVLASGQQGPIQAIVSDGTTLFWVSCFPGSVGPFWVFAMPVDGGPVTTLISTRTNGGAFLAVDALDVYAFENGSLVRIPKNGAPATLVNEEGATVTSATTLGGNAYWTENVGDGGPEQPIAVRSGPLQGDDVVTLATFTPDFSLSYWQAEIGVTSTTVFFGNMSAPSPLYFFPMSGLPTGGPAPSGSTSCGSLGSDTDAVYCAQASGAVMRIASDGTAASMGVYTNPRSVVTDDTYAYWVDDATDGAVFRAPKSGNGAATVLARDTSPYALAVDDNWVYWVTPPGTISRIAK